jgi:hypothetical protein
MQRSDSDRGSELVQSNPPHTTRSSRLRNLGLSVVQCLIFCVVMFVVFVFALAFERLKGKTGGIFLLLIIAPGLQSKLRVDFRSVSNSEIQSASQPRFPHILLHLRASH